MNNEEKILALLEAQLKTLEAHSEVLDTLVLAVNSLADGQAETNKRIEKLKQGQTRLQESVVKIELEHGQKLGALFDGYSLLNNTINRIDSNLTVLTQIQEAQELHILRLDESK